RRLPARRWQQHWCCSSSSTASCSRWAFTTSTGSSDADRTTPTSSVRRPECRLSRLRSHTQRSQNNDHNPDLRRRHSRGISMVESYLPVIWAAVMGLAVVMYVVLDGFDLGVGILFPFAETDQDRDQMMSSVGPFWDGNETWLVLGGAGLLVS